MSFRFNWPEFDPTFYTEAKSQLETALNKEKKSKHIAGHIFVNELNMGSKAPELKILEICELSTDYFRGIFKLSYDGDSSIALQTKIQANPLYTPPTYKLSHNVNYYHLPRLSRPDIVAAAQPLVIPMLLRISDVRLNGIIMLSISKSKGITLVFKNDPLESLLVSSTFDIVDTIKSFLQHQIESQLRTFLQDTLPLVVHEFSLRHTSNQQQEQPSLKNSSTFTSPLESLHQQQYYTNLYDQSDLHSVPELTPSSSSSISECCFSDTSSEHLSFGLNDNDDLVYESTFGKYIKNNTATPLQYLAYTTNSTTGMSLYDSDLEQNQSFSHHFDTAEDYEPLTTTTATGLSSTTHFRYPITLSSTTHGLLKRMQHLSASSQTLAIGSNDTIDSLVHKSGIMVLKSNEQLRTRRKKIPKRRIIRWNP